jgi:hypothetical protein
VLIDYMTESIVPGWQQAADTQSLPLCMTHGHSSAQSI